jgi:hypothetical protein
MARIRTRQKNVVEQQHQNKNLNWNRYNIVFLQFQLLPKILKTQAEHCSTTIKSNHLKELIHPKIIVDVKW